LIFQKNQPRGDIFFIANEGDIKKLNFQKIQPRGDIFLWPMRQRKKIDFSKKSAKRRHFFYSQWGSTHRARMQKIQPRGDIFLWPMRQHTRARYACFHAMTAFPHSYQNLMNFRPPPFFWGGGRIYIKGWLKGGGTKIKPTFFGGGGEYTSKAD